MSVLSPKELALMSILAKALKNKATTKTITTVAFILPVSQDQFFFP
ncbi:hypothetical protein LEP1GSC058_2478 [Leptospira fainei serovar Hurstbridge str. BUT 6]|uniref:Uncharacterized protein n=1 Tax=Leptospira fainei serovar Hurstbridge str. BUT 6 TaxID=1193011 RepID=S3UXW5_9LEPT|nr:hypothetical protein LEP1GSC058_2478 [Leptospira fainei serovar Hurstbridge str. BUT 6]